VAADDGAVGAEGGAFTDEGAGVDAVNGEVGTGRGDIGEHAGGTAEDVVFYLYAFVDRDVVLDAHAVAYLDVVADVDVLAEGAALTEGGAALDVAEVPDFGAGTDGYVVVDIAAFVNEIVLHVWKEILQRSTSEILDVRLKAHFFSARFAWKLFKN